MKNKPQYKYEKLRAEIHGRGSVHIFLWMLLVAGLLAGALCFVRLRSATETCRADASRLERELDIRVKELENLRMQQETLTSGRYIRSAVERMGLDLRQSEHGQVRRMVVTRQIAPDGNRPRAMVASTE